MLPCFDHPKMHCTVNKMLFLLQEKLAEGQISFSLKTIFQFEGASKESSFTNALTWQTSVFNNLKLEGIHQNLLCKVLANLILKSAIKVRVLPPLGIPAWPDPQRRN